LFKTKLDMSGLRELHKQLKDVKIKVGLPKGTPANKDGVSLIEIGAVQEFGSPAKNIPERSFIRIPLDNAKADYFKFIKKQGINILNGKQSTADATEKLGVWGQTVIKKSFTNNNWAPNSEVTINGGWINSGGKAVYVKGKGSSRPLIDSGQLRQAITWEVVK